MSDCCDLPLDRPAGVDGTFTWDTMSLMAPVQHTFTRGNYTGHWIDDKASDRADYIKEVTGFPPPNGSGSLEILFKGERETVLVDKAEHAAEKVFNKYCEPDWRQLAEEILGDYLKDGVPFSAGLKAIADNDRYIQHDVYSVLKILHSLLANEGYNPRDFSEFDEIYLRTVS